MNVFNFGARKKTESHSCVLTRERDAILPCVSLVVLGSGCAACNKLEAAAHAALKELGMCGTVEHVHDVSRIAAHGVIATPALVVNGKVIIRGRLPSTKEIVRLIQDALRD